MRTSPSKEETVIISGNADVGSVRRVVTTHDLADRSKLALDDVSYAKKVGTLGVSAVQLWTSEGSPADISAGSDFEDAGARAVGTAPPLHGTRFVIVDFPPGASSPMHRTETLDYAIVIEGQIEMDLDEGTVRLMPGDCVVQRGTNHAWRNVGTNAARLAAVLIDAAPLDIGSPIKGPARVE